MAGSRQDELYDALQLKGYPEDFCREIAYRQMNTDYTATRMLGVSLQDIRTETGGCCR